MKIAKIVKKLSGSLGARIVLPYALLTMVVAGVGAFVVTSLVSGTLRERFNNQLLDAGRLAAEAMVSFEEDRLAVVRAVARTDGVATALEAADAQQLGLLVPQLLANSAADEVVLLDGEGQEVAAWQRDGSQLSRTQGDGEPWTGFEAVQLSLEGAADELGDKRAFLADMPYGHMLYTAGPVYEGERPVGAVLVGSRADRMVLILSEFALARVTLYDSQGRVIASTLGVGGQGTGSGDPTEQLAQVAEDLRESPERVVMVAGTAESQVQFDQVEVLNQHYQLAFGDWRLRGESFGLFSVALPSNFIVTAAATSRNLFNMVFVLATAAVFAVGYLISRRIVKPLTRLLSVSSAVAQGDLNQRTGIARSDEIGVLAASFDSMTEKLAQRNRELVEHASKLEAILNSISDAVVVLDSNEQVSAMNPAALALSKTGVGVPVVDLLLALKEQEVDENGAAALSGGVSRHIDRYELGQQVMSVRAAPVDTGNGHGKGSVIVLRDVTREAEAETLKDAFVSSVSHELRTPLTVISASADLLLLKNRESLDTWQADTLTKIRKSVRELTRHIQKLIDLGEIEAGTSGRNRHPMQLGKLIREVADDWRGPMADKGLEFTFELPNEELTINGAEEHLKWAVDNLLSNAHNYTLPGGRVRIAASDNGTEACVEVSDTGIGIAASDRPHIFDRFYRSADERNYAIHGVGLGLYITRAVVEMHGGAINVESDPGAGSVFRVRLPLCN